MRSLLTDTKNITILLLTALLLIQIPAEDISFIWWVLTGIAISALLDFLIQYVFYHRRIIPKSAIITGAIVSGVISYHEPWYLLALFCGIAIISKHVVRYRNSHFLNPANAGLFTATMLGIPLTWNIQSNSYLIIICGCYLAYSLRKIPHVVAFIMIFSLLSLTNSINPIGLINWFFVFVMLIEPKTSGVGIFRGVSCGAITAIAAFLSFSFIPQYDFFIIGLFIANLFNPVLAITKKKYHAIFS